MGQIVKLFQFERTSGVLLIAAIVLALAAANSPLAPIYNIVHHTPILLRLGPLVIDEPLVRWINEGLMVLFFVLVGLEIKRHFLEGHLSTAKRAALPAIAALGGMAVPAAIYAGLNWTDPVAIRGWAIPTATDIVLALGLLSLLGPRVPTSLKVFLTALAIFDDIGAVLIIGLFYAESLSLSALVVAGFALLGLALLNVLRITRPAAYVVLGVVLWVAMFKSGVESALAGVLIALAVPLHAPGCGCSSPLRATERWLHPWAALGVVPLFAFFNAGVTIDPNILASFPNSVFAGVVGGLFLGKQVGIFGTAWVAVALGIAQLPQGVTWAQLHAVAILAGMGFTMSLFVASLAFVSPAVLASAKLSILSGSLISGIVGLSLIYMTTARTRPPLADSSNIPTSSL